MELEQAIPNPEPEKPYLTYSQKYYTKNKEKWKTYNKFEKVYCDICKKEFVFIKQHLKTGIHKLNLKMKQKDDLIKSVLETII